MYSFIRMEVEPFITLPLNSGATVYNLKFLQN